MKSKKIDLVAGYEEPEDRNVLWLNYNEQALMYYDGEQWIKTKQI